MAIKNNNEEKMKKLSTENICDVSGGEIVQTKSGKFKIIDAEGDNVFAKGRSFQTLEEAINVATLMGESTAAITREQRKLIKKYPPEEGIPISLLYTDSEDDFED